jgi:hypothetical protein
MKEIYEDAINYLKYYGEKNHSKIENIAYFLDCELKNYIKLQSNWNNLREIIKDLGIDYLLDKMNELEGENKQ